MNEDIKDFKIPTMEEFEEKIMGHKKKKQEETKEEENIEEEKQEQPKQETREQKLATLKERAKQKRQELDSIYKEIENEL